MCCDVFADHRCSTCNRNQEVVAREGRRTYRLRNPSAKLICKVRIDGCYITDGEKCDYLIIDCEGRDARFVELKGGDLLKAVDQIRATVERLRPDVEACQKVSARIVLSKVRVPNFRNEPKVLRLEKLLRRRGGDLDCRSQFMSETLP